MRNRHLVAASVLTLASHGLLPAVAQGEVIVRMETSLGDIYVELYDQTAPITVANFLSYVDDGDYVNTFIHRSATSPFIIQGGGYISQNGSYSLVPADPPIVNEYGADRPNSRGTIAMARTANPNSATSEWFFNIGDNSAALGPFNTGGYAVFGRVLDSNDDTITTNDGDSMAVVDAIAALDRWNGTGIDPQYDSAWHELPLIGFSAGQTFVPSQHLVMINQISMVRSLLRATSHAGNAVTLVTPAPATLANLVASGTPDRSGMPAGVLFREGFFAFEINNLTPGGTASVALELPEDFYPDTYYMYGPTPNNPTDHWYEFKFDGRTGAEFFDNNYVVLNFVDGERGDADLTANGTVIDPGAPGITTVAASSSSGGGCSLSANTHTTSIPLDFGLLALAFLARLMYRIMRPLGDRATARR